MRIHQLTIKNLLGITEIDIEPYPGVNVIAGNNGQGKTSLLNAIWFALAGEAAQKQVNEPIREGEKSAEVTVDLGEFTVTRKWRDGKPSELVVTAKDGVKYSKPRAFLDEKLGALSFDPLAFSRMDSKTQLKTLLALVELPFDPEELASKRKDIYDQRTDINRDLKRAQSVLASLPEAPDDVPDEELSSAQLIREIQEGQFILNEYQGCLARRDHLNVLIGRLMQELADAQSAEADNEEQIKGFELPNLEELEQQLQSIETINEAVRLKKRTKEATEQVSTLERDAKKCTDAIEHLDQVKEDGLKAANLPVHGLSFDDDGVSLHSIPFAQCSGAEKLMASILIGVAMNPDIRIMRIEDGPLLDDESMKLLAQVAEEQDMQVFVERLYVHFGLPSFIIRDGSLVDDEPF